MILGLGIAGSNIAGSVSCSAWQQATSRQVVCDAEYAILA